MHVAFEILMLFEFLELFYRGNIVHFVKLRMNHQLTINKFLFTLAVQRKYLSTTTANQQKFVFFILLLFRLGGIDIIIGLRFLFYFLF